MEGFDALIPFLWPWQQQKGGGGMLIFSSMRILANSMLAFFARKWILAVEESRELHKRQVTKSGTSDIKVQW